MVGLGPDMCEAVVEAFVRLYEAAGLIYRGTYTHITYGCVGRDVWLVWWWRLSCVDTRQGCSTGVRRLVGWVGGWLGGWRAGASFSHGGNQIRTQNRPCDPSSSSFFTNANTHQATTS